MFLAPQLEGFLWLSLCLHHSAHFCVSSEFTFGLQSPSQFQPRCFRRSWSHLGLRVEEVIQAPNNPLNTFSWAKLIGLELDIRPTQSQGDGIKFLLEFRETALVFPPLDLNLQP